MLGSRSARRPRPFGWPEGHEQGEVLGDAVEPMRHGGPHEHDRARTDVADLVADGDPAPARDHVVDLILGMWPLEIRLADRQAIQPDAQVGDREELQVRVAARRALRDEIGQVEGIHRPNVAASGTAPRGQPYDGSMLPTNPGDADARGANPSPFRLVLVALLVVALVILAVAVVAGPPKRNGGAGPTVAPGTSARAGASGFEPGRVAVTLQPFAAGLTAPLAIVNAGDGSGRLFVAEQGGRIRVIAAGTVAAQPFLDLADRITAGGERGLLGLAFAPGYPSDPRLFVDYTDRNGDTEISSFTVRPTDAGQADPASEVRILHVSQPFANHNGGALLFDPSGMLLISLGDGGSGGDPQGNGQSLATLLGKILRIDVRQTTADHPYAIPPDNPFVPDPDEPLVQNPAGPRLEIWLSGLRNPWRMSLDRTTHDLWIGDVGQDAWEEIDVQRVGAPAGTNFGWNRMEGTHCFEPAAACASEALILPVSDYGHDLGCTVIGGAVYRGSAQTALRGGYVFADYCSGRIWAIDAAGGGYRQPVLVDESGINPSAFGEDEAGELFVADIAGGRILRVTAGPR